MEFLNNLKQFFKEVAAEFKKVNWPTRKEVMNSTVIIIFVVVIIATFLWAVDIALARLVSLVLR